MLVVSVGGKTYTFHREFSVGANPGPGNITLMDPFASTRHARIYQSQGSWWVQDLGTTNGTWLNNEKIYGSYCLEKGDRIRIGRTTLIVVPT